METPRYLDEVKNFPLSPPPPPGGYDLREIAECGFPEFLPSHPYGTNQLSIRCILNNEFPLERKATNYPPRVELPELEEIPNVLLLPVLQNTHSLKKGKVALNIRPNSHSGLENEITDANSMSLMKTFVEKTYIRKIKKQKMSTNRGDTKSPAPKEHELADTLRHMEERKLADHMNIGRTIQINSLSGKRRSSRRSFAALGA
uniref:Uncharacterized protein n=2 Tax=Ditylum brightwellii TaxID=49249 RepID=A0A6S9CE79_9STRA|mmetsp:Transcript_12057/g.17576  ORF Transcript_12057/g.17576 Transcript_12057/m.17576 type:complete len:202 (-) Transcript_12057:165-770(-)